MQQVYICRQIGQVTGVQGGSCTSPTRKRRFPREILSRHGAHRRVIRITASRAGSRHYENEIQFHLGYRSTFLNSYNLISGKTISYKTTSFTTRAHLQQTSVMHHTKAVILFLLLNLALSLASACPAAAWAAANGSISGTITDPSGAVVPGATITVV